MKIVNEAVLADIKSRGLTNMGWYECGCFHLRSKSWHVCDYHQGFIDGYDAAAEGTTEATNG